MWLSLGLSFEAIFPLHHRVCYPCDFSSLWMHVTVIVIWLTTPDTGGIGLAFSVLHTSDGALTAIIFILAYINPMKCQNGIKITRKVASITNDFTVHILIMSPILTIPKAKRTR